MEIRKKMFAWYSTVSLRLSIYYNERNMKEVHMLDRESCDR